MEKKHGVLKTLAALQEGDELQPSLNVGGIADLLPGPFVSRNVFLFESQHEQQLFLPLECCL